MFSRLFGRSNQLSSSVKSSGSLSAQIPAKSVLQRRYSSLPSGVKQREKAWRVTSGFEDGTVGYGVHASIAEIKGIWGEEGAEQIGDVFASEEAQETLAQRNTYKNNLKMAKIEYAYWSKVYAQFLQEKKKIPNILRLAVFAKPPLRAGIQMTLGDIRYGLTHNTDEDR